MMKPGPNYRMSKAGKIYLATTWHRANRSARRKTLILGELHGSLVVKSKRDRDN